MSDAPPTALDEVALRAEHDELARRLEVRRSVDELRTALYGGFASVISFGLTVKFAWDRWGWSKVPKPPPRGRYPLLVLAAALLFVGLLAYTLRHVRRARALRAGEDRLAARFEELRRTLRLDP